MIFLFPVWWNMDWFPERENISDLLVLLGISRTQGKYSPWHKRFILSTCHMCTQQAPQQTICKKKHVQSKKWFNLVVALSSKKSICFVSLYVGHTFDYLVDAFGRESLKFYTPQATIQNFFALDVIGREPLSTGLIFSTSIRVSGQYGWHMRLIINHDIECVETDIIWTLTRLQQEVWRIWIWGYHRSQNRAGSNWITLTFIACTLLWASWITVLIVFSHCCSLLCCQLRHEIKQLQYMFTIYHTRVRIIVAHCGKPLIKEPVQLDGHTWHLQGIQHAFACKPSGICQDVMEGRVWWIFFEYDDVGDAHDDDDDDDAQLTYLPNGYVSHQKSGEGFLHYCHIECVNDMTSYLYDVSDVPLFEWN